MPHIYRGMQMLKNTRGQAFYNRFGAEVEYIEGPVLLYRYLMTGLLYLAYKPEQ